jgi:biopolymer transport protein ExbD
MAFAGGNSGGVKNDINVTPLVDVVLVLLIIFMVVTPMLQRGKPVELPKAEMTEKENKEADPLVVSITSEAKTYVESDEVTNDTLITRLTEELAKTPGKRILLKGDGKLTYGDVRKVMDKIRQAGFKGVGLGVEEKKK